MSTTVELYELAQRAIQDYYRDRTAPLAEIKEGLTGLRDEISGLVDSLTEAEVKEDANGPTGSTSGEGSSAI